MKRTAANVTISADKLPETAKDALIEYREQGESAWRGIASITSDIIAEVEARGLRVNRAALYTTVGALAGRSANTIQQWTGVYKRVESLIGVYSFLGFDHWRVLLAHASKSGEELKEVTERAMREAENAGYADPSVDVLIATLCEDGIERLDAPRSVKTLDRVGRAVIAHDKALAVGDAGVQHGQREAWATVRAAWEDYAGKYGATD